MAELGPLMITAHNRAQAEYVVTSRAQQRGIQVQAIDVDAAGPGVWAVTVTVSDTEVTKGLAAALDEDTQVIHLRNHPSRRDREQDIEG